MRPAFVAALTICAGCIATTAVRASPTSRLVYARAPGAEACPDETALRRAVAARVGYDPFFAWAPKTVVASFSRETGGGFAARVVLVDELGAQHGARVLRVGGPCADLFEAAALAIAIAIDPQSLTAPEPSPPSTPALPLAPAPAPVTRGPWRDQRGPREERARREGEVPAPRRVAFAVSAGAVMASAGAPVPAVGGVVGFAVLVGRWSLGVEGRIDAPGSAPAAGGGRVSSWLVTGGLSVCTDPWPLFVCAIGEAGRLRAMSEGVAVTKSASFAWLTAGGRVGVEIPIERQVGLRVRSDLVADLDRPRVRLNGNLAWSAPAAAAGFGGDIVVHFP